MKNCLFALSLLALGCSTAFAAQQQNGSSQTRQSHMPQSSMTQSGKIQWYTNFSQALSMAKNSNKPLLLFFTGSDWCGWCKKMDHEVFASPEFMQAVGNKFVFVMVDFPMNRPLPANQQQENNQLKQQFGVTGFPTIIILDSKGNFIAETGYRPGGGKAYAEYLEQLMK